MDGVALKEGVILLEFEALGGVLTVFGGDVTRHTWHAAILLLGAFEDDLYAVALCFFCHGCNL